MNRTSRGLIAWFTYNPVAANLLMLIVMVGGVISIGLINKEIFPSFALNRISITTVYSGAAPEEIEKTINGKIEQTLTGLNGIKRMTSRAVESQGVVVLELEKNTDIDDIYQKVKQRVDAITTFPLDIETPIVLKDEFLSNVVYLSVYGDASDRQLKEFAKQLKDSLLLNTSATNAELSGVKDYEIAIEINEYQRRKHNLTLSQIAKAIEQQSINLPSGSIKALDGDLLVRAKGQRKLGDQFSDVVVKYNGDGSRVYLTDIATISDGFAEQVILNRFNQQRAVVIQIRNLTSEDASQIAKEVSQFAKDEQAKLPEGIYIDSWADMSHYLEGRLNMMLSNMLYGGILVFLILALFLELRLAFWVILGLPFCFLGTLLLMPFEGIGVSINLISLFGFILVLGIVVDDAIVVGESVYAEVEKQGNSIETVIKGAKRVAIPATFGVLTTIAAFLPMLLSDNPRTEFFKSIGWVVVLCLIFSLIESKWILPAHLARSKLVDNTQNKGRLSQWKFQFNQRVSLFIDRDYRRFIRFCLSHKYSVLATFIGVLIIALSLVYSGQLRWVFFPKLPSDYIQVMVDMERSSSDQQNKRVALQLEQALYQVDEHYQTELGLPVVKHSFLNMSDDSTMFVLVELEKGENLPVSSFDILEQWKSAIPPLVGVKKIRYEASIGRSTGDIQFSLKGKELRQLQQAAQALKYEISMFDGTYNIEDDLASQNQEAILKLKPIGQALGLTLADVATQVRHAFYGYEVDRVLRDKEEVKVMVRAPKMERTSLGYLQRLFILLPNGNQVPFSEVASVELETAFTQVNRVNSERAVVVSANVFKNEASPSHIVKTLKQEVMPRLKNQYPNISFDLDGEVKDEQDTQSSLARDAVIALFTIYALMAIPLRSYVQPLIIMSVIPFGIIGAIAGHYFAGLTLNLLSVFGILALAGVVVNDSLVLVTFINRAREQGMKIEQAVEEAGCHRFRAIVLTSLTTFCGLAPILLEKSLQAQIVIPMATSLAFGILFATVVTLILVPSLYLILNELGLRTNIFNKDINDQA
ncbi:TPA: efflux RND transporter permease subunit [Photobacterium damselae]